MRTKYTLSSRRDLCAYVHDCRSSNYVTDIANAWRGCSLSGAGSNRKGQGRRQRSRACRSIRSRNSSQPARETVRRKNVIATASSKEKLDCLVNLPGGIGPTHGVNYKTQDFAEEVKKITDGKGANVVIDFVGQSHWHKNIAALAVDGHMTMLGLLSGE